MPLLKIIIHSFLASLLLATLVVDSVIVNFSLSFIKLTLKRGLFSEVLKHLHYEHSAYFIIIRRCLSTLTFFLCLPLICHATGFCPIAVWRVPIKKAESNSECVDIKNKINNKGKASDEELKRSHLPGTSLSNSFSMFT